jgi:uncharacterized protein YjbI with pentapeptide repeats
MPRGSRRGLPARLPVPYPVVAKCDLCEEDSGQNNICVKHYLHDTRPPDAEPLVVKGEVDLSGVVFDSRVTIRNVTFEGPVDFRRAGFSEWLQFDHVTFLHPVRFAHAHFDHRVNFNHVRFADDAEFSDIAFARYARFTTVAFEGEAWFQQAVFSGDLLFDEVTFGRKAHLSRVTFAGATVLSLTSPDADFSLSTFHRRARIEVGDGRLTCDRTVFDAGARLTASGPADVTLHDVHFGAPSTLSAAAGTVGSRRMTDRPRLHSVVGTDLAGLTLSYVDLSRCSFGGAHNLDKLTVEGWQSWGHSPRGFWVTRRTVLADERRRRARSGSPRWAIPGDDPDAVISAEVQGDYHALRRMYDAAKDEPAVTDFYYGEMEMRRRGLWQEFRVRVRERWWRGLTGSFGEWLLVSLYWLLSGYGVRAWRALASLAVVVAVASAAFVKWGFPGKSVAYGDAVRFSVRAATSLLRGTDTLLTPAGEWIELVLRLIAPLLLALALLAIRSRVRR